MNATPFNVGAYVHGPPTSPRGLVLHVDLLTAYADGTIDDEREAYLSHFAFGPEMRSHFAANRNSVAGYGGPCGGRWIVLDIDRADLAVALADARRLVRAIHLRYPEAEGDVPVYFSGGKGFHVLVELAHRPPPVVGFHRTAKTFAEALAGLAGVRIDTAVFDIAHIIRLPNTRHPRSGLFKRRIDSDALFKLDVPSILDHAKHPSGDGLPNVRTCPANLAEDWHKAERAAARAADARAVVRRDSGPVDARAPRYLLELIRFGVDAGERHNTLFRSAAWLIEQGAPPSLVFALLTEPGLDLGLSPKDVDRQIRCGIEHARRQRGLSPDDGFDADLERWAIQHEADPLDFPYGALAPAEGGAGMTPTYTTGADLFNQWYADVERGEPPVRYGLPDPFTGLDVRPDRLFLFGGAPGGGKTAALMQIGIDLLRQNESVRMLVANVEMIPTRLVERVASRLSAVPLTAIADRTLTPDERDRLQAAVVSLEPVAGRLAFLHAPFALEHVAAAGTAFNANVMILDYIQRFTVGEGKGDKREQLEAAATVLRRFCDTGATLLVASAVARQRSNTGSTYNGLTLASFRGSSELEYGCDAAYLLVPDGSGGIVFQCEKNRYGAVADLVTRFDPITQTFATAPAGLDGFDAVTPAPPRGKKPQGC